MVKVKGNKMLKIKTKSLLKNILILSSIISISNAAVYDNRKKENNQNNSDEIHFSGKVFNVSEYRNYIEMSISTEEDGRVKVRINSNPFKIKENDRVKGICYKKDFGTYENCSIYKY